MKTDKMLDKISLIIGIINFALLVSIIVKVYSLSEYYDFDSIVNKTNETQMFCAASHQSNLRMIQCFYRNSLLCDDDPASHFRHS